MLVVVLASLWTSLGVGFLSFVAGIKGVDEAQYEAGAIDGIKNRWQELWYITLPNMKPQLLFGARYDNHQFFVCRCIWRYDRRFPKPELRNTYHRQSFE